VTSSFGDGSRRRVFLFVLLAILSTSAKVYVAGLGHNIDVESWSLLAGLVLDGKNVYAETPRNNWGPLWCHLLAATKLAQIHVLRSDSLVDFHRLVAFVLALADVGIGFLLARSFSFAAGLLFLVNPVSLLISGFHSQFENVAILLGLWGCLLLDSDSESKPWRFASGLLLLGLSLIAKHVLVFLPLWFFLRPGSSRERRLLYLAPLGIFGASFLPFIGDERGLEGVIEHVLTYGSFHLDAFFPHVVSGVVPIPAIELLFSWVPLFSGFKFLWLVSVVFTGFLVRTKSHRDQLLVYLVAMVVFSSALADQYLAIPLATCAVFFRRFTSWWYVGVTTLYLSASPVNVGMLPGLTPCVEAVRAVGIERWHSVAALFLFLLLGLSRPGRLETLREPEHADSRGEREPGESERSRRDEREEGRTGE
jgi:hypothetical protein